MAYHTVDLEKQQQLITTAETSPASPSSSPKSPLAIYQTLVGDVSAKSSQDDDSLYHDVVVRERRAKRYYILSGLAFALCVLAQIVLCLGIAIGAQVGLSKNAISILAGVNTGVAAGIAVMKGLGLPEKMAIERRKLQKVAEKIRFTTRRLKAGLAVDAAQEADAVMKMEEEAEDEAQVLQQVGDAAAAMPAKGGAEQK